MTSEKQLAALSLVSTSRSAFSSVSNRNSSSQSTAPPPLSRQSTRRDARPCTANPATACRDSNLVLAVIEGRGIAGWVGLAAMDLRTSECFLSQYADTQTFVKTLHKLSIYSPIEILLSTTAIEPIKSKLCGILEETQGNAQIVPVARKYFNDNVGLNYVKQYCLQMEVASLLVSVTSQHYCLAAVAALLQYVRTSQSVLFTANSIRFKYQACEGTMMIDSVTSRSLELIYNLANARNGQSLYGTLNHTRTPMGARLLRTNILQPLTDIATIETRMDAVEELTQNEETFFAAQAALKPFLDVDHLITSLNQIHKNPSVKHAEQNITNVIMLQHVLRLVQPLRDALIGRQSELLQAVRTILFDEALDVVLERIEEVLNEDVAWTKSAIGQRNQRCYAIKAGFNGLLDVARQTYKETVDDIYEMVASYSDRVSLPLKLNFSPTTGFTLSCTSDSIAESGNSLPLIFINVVKRKKILTFTTLELIKKNDRCNESLTEAYLISDKTVSELIDGIRAHVGVLYKASESIAMLDMLVSFAHRCTIAEYVRPSFSMDTLAIKNGRHPIKETLAAGAFVPNDCYASDGTSFQVITGPNLSGKSTYLRQIALLSVMSQIGSFVPAEFATFRIVDRLFGRIACDDNIEAAASTFTAEMRETAYILQNITDQSLAIIDELGRGTSTYDGVGITFAVCEKLLRKKAFVFFATHFRDIATTLEMYKNVVNLHMDVQVDKCDQKHDSRDQIAVRYLYSVKDGYLEDDGYGLWLARISGFPEGLVEEATKISNKLKSIASEHKAKSQGMQNIQLRRLLHQITHRLVQVQRQSNQLEEDELRKYLAELQDEAQKTGLHVKRKKAAQRKNDME